MVVDERSRHALYRRLEEVLGPEAATTLIEHLPPVGWADVATRHDVAGLEQRMELRFARIEERFNAMDHRLTAVTSDVRADFERELRAQTTTFERELRSQSTAFQDGL
ncbi:MAG: hypothetical protein ACRD07_08785, partial [Acidimicrobiales bacterium]